MKTTFYLIRHGETAWNAEGKLQGHTDIELSDKGRTQAVDVASELKSAHPQAIYASPLSRARETAEIIGEKLGLPVQIVESLRERKLGGLEGKTKEEMRALYPDWATMTEAERFTDDREGTESAENTAERILGTLRLLAKNHTGQTVFCVSHGGNIRFTLVKLGYGTLDTILGIQNCGYIVISLDGTECIVEKVERIREAL